MASRIRDTASSGSVKGTDPMPVAAMGVKGNSIFVTAILSPDGLETFFTYPLTSKNL
jgi:hypothetical protein